MNHNHPTPEIPDHEVIRKIGSGAYGEVWLARTITGAWRAIKIVRRDDFDDDRSFQREFEGIRHYEPIARNHPGLVHILHVGKSLSPSPFYYYVMELGDDCETETTVHPSTYVPRTLQTDKKLADKKPLPIDYVLEIGLQLSDALSYLHSQGLTHRDIKPANIIFVHNLPKLADVGLVALRNQRTFVGTEGFIPHEGPGTERADVYALSKVLYELATGRDRLDFPELPDEFPEDYDRKTWLSLNNVICSACDPQPDRCTIETAQKLHDALKAIKKGKAFDCHSSKGGFFSSPGKALAALSGIALTFTAVTAALFLFVPERKPSVTAVDPRPEKEHGNLVITTQPSGAAIYDAQGTYIDETPYGPISLPIGMEVSFTLKKPGYKDWTEKGVIRADKTLGIGGALIPYKPPVSGKVWQDSEEQNYVSQGEIHKTTIPVSADSVSKFYLEKGKLTSVKSVLAKEEQTGVEHSLALMTPSEALEYTEWLTGNSLTKGLLAENQAISPIPVRKWETWKIEEADKKERLSAYLLQAGEINYVNAHIDSSPQGATVTLNGFEIGKTPIDWPKLSPGHVTLSFKLPGYKREEISKTISKNNDLKVTQELKPDSSITFNKEWKNSLGMEFAPISSTLSASKFETRKADFHNYLNEQKLSPPPAPDFKETLSHPVVNVTREEAQRFADWLTQKEQRNALIESTDYYRLPTDQEWTALAGGGKEEGRVPSERHTATFSPELGSEYTSDLFPWGNTWPPAPGTGNFADKSIGETKTISHYNDGHAYTAPVGQFQPNRLGLYDLTGNVWEWVEDDYGGPADFKFRTYQVARGGGWQTSKAHELLTRYRLFFPPNTSESYVGFRLVLVRRDPPKDNETWDVPQSDDEENDTPIPITPVSTTPATENGESPAPAGKLPSQTDLFPSFSSPQAGTPFGPQKSPSTKNTYGKN